MSGQLYLPLTTEQADVLFCLLDVCLNPKVEELKTVQEFKRTVLCAYQEEYDMTMTEEVVELYMDKFKDWLSKEPEPVESRPIIKTKNSDE